MGSQNKTFKMAQIISLAFALIILCGHINSLNCLTVNQLHGKYYEIFSRAYNRNAASHLWASYIIERSSSMTRAEILNLFGGFCPVSGSPVSPSPGRIWHREPATPARWSLETSMCAAGHASVTPWSMSEQIKSTSTLATESRHSTPL